VGKKNRLLILTRAIRSNQNADMDQILNSKKKHVITSLCQEILPRDAVHLLRILIDRLNTTCASVSSECWITWLRSLLLKHHAYFTSNTESLFALSKLANLIEARLLTHRSIHVLSGKLDFLLADRFTF